MIHTKTMRAWLEKQFEIEKQDGIKETGMYGYQNIPQLMKHQDKYFEKYKKYFIPNRMTELFNNTFKKEIDEDTNNKSNESKKAKTSI